MVWCGGMWNGCFNKYYFCIIIILMNKIKTCIFISNVYFYNCFLLIFLNLPMAAFSETSSQLLLRV